MRLIARFAQEQERYFEIITVYDERIVKERLNKSNPALISISANFPAAVWFERKISDDFGIEILYSNDTRPLIKHERFPRDISPMRKSYTKLSVEDIKVSSILDKNNGVVLGPTHPYHLESSELQLFEKDKKILHFEILPFFKYRGIEKMVEGLTLKEAREIVERISASESIAYQLAFLDLELQASKKRVPEMLRKRHLFLLELERIINYLNDLSIVCQLLELNEAATLFSRFLEEGRGALKRLTGHRFGFGAIVLDGEYSNMEDIHEYLFSLEKELLLFEKWIKCKKETLLKMSTLAEVSKSNIERYGLVGIMARSSNINLDRRYADKLYKKSDFFINLRKDGDTLSRFNIRIAEIFSSIRMMKNLVSNNILPLFYGTPMDGEYYSYIEASSGELMMYVSLKNGVIDRFYLRDGSFLTAQLLPEIVKSSDVSDLGLILNSIPLNISAIDL